MRPAIAFPVALLLIGCIDHNQSAEPDDDILDTCPSASPDTDGPAPPRHVVATDRPDAGESPAGDRPICSVTVGALFAPAADAPAPDGCEAQCLRLSHCASYTWDDGSDQCRCLEDDDEPGIRAACVQACHTTQGESLHAAIFSAPVCSEIVPAVAARFPAFSRACGGLP